MTNTDSRPEGGPAVGAISQRHARRRGPLRLLGLALIAYGVAGLILLGVVGSTLASPIRDLESITGAVEAQRTAALDSLRRAGETITRTGAAVRGTDRSLADAKAATDRASSIALGIATSMNQLADAMSLTIFGVQPLIGLQPGFSQSAAQLALLATDLATIGTALESNRRDAATVAGSLDELGDSLERLATAVGAGPKLDDAAESLETVRVGVVALLAWLAVLALGSIGAGIGCWWLAAQR